MPLSDHIFITPLIYLYHLRSPIFIALYFSKYPLITTRRNYYRLSVRIYRTFFVVSEIYEYLRIGPTVRDVSRRASPRENRGTRDEDAAMVVDRMFR